MTAGNGGFRIPKSVYSLGYECDYDFDYDQDISR
jgi:hypothetical protein